MTSGSAIMTGLQSLQYDGDRRNFDFNKYVALHVARHNNHNDLGEYGVEPLTESLKILWFQKGITYKSLDTVWASILTAPCKLHDLHRRAGSLCELQAHAEGD